MGNTATRVRSADGQDRGEDKDNGFDRYAVDSSWVFEFEGIEMAVKVRPDPYDPEALTLILGENCVVISYPSTPPDENAFVTTHLDELLFDVGEGGREGCPGYRKTRYGRWLMKLVDHANIDMLNATQCKLSDVSIRETPYEVLDKSLGAFLIFRRGYTFYEGHDFIPVKMEPGVETFPEAVDRWNMILRQRHSVLTDPAQLKTLLTTLKLAVQERCGPKVCKRKRKRDMTEWERMRRLSARCQGLKKALKYLKVIMKLGRYNNLQELANGMWADFLVMRKDFLGTSSSHAFRSTTKVLYEFVAQTIAPPIACAKYYRNPANGRPVKLVKSFEEDGLMQVRWEYTG